MGFIIVSLFFLGTIFGSFVNVLIDRLPRGESLIKGRSHCDSCKKRIKSYDLIPVISYLLLRGKCRHCKAKIPRRVITVEIVSGFQFTLLFLFSFESLASFILLCAVSLLVLAIAVIDIEHGIILDILLVALGVIAVFYILLLAPLLFLSHFITGFVAFLFFFIVFLVTRGRGIGFGDVKYAFFIGFLLGSLLTIVAMYVAFLTGALLSIILVIAHKKKLKGSTIPFGPFLSLGVFVSILIGPELIQIVRPYIGF